MLLWKAYPQKVNVYMRLQNSAFVIKDQSVC